MKLGESRLAFWSLVFSGALILAAIILPPNINVPDPLGFIAFWGIFVIHLVISILVMKRGFLVPFICSLAWFFVTGLAVFTAGIAVHGIP
jgi:hypothetical protein